MLVMGLGLIGGGVATTKWIVRQGAFVTVTDLKTRKELLPSIKALGAAAKKTRFVLGRHNEEDFRIHDCVVVNPGVPKESLYLKIARKANARIINDAVLFFEYLPKENPIIAVTGTRGKTTTANWIAHFLQAKWPNVRAAGNTPENPLLKEFERLKKYPGTPAVLELSSWQLEYLPETHRALDVAVITNLYPDHLNRYASMKAYARAKANIFKNQTKKQILILNKENEWTKWFLAQKPRSRVYISRYQDIKILRYQDTHTSKYRDVHMGEHNVQNLRAAALVAHLMGVSWKDMRGKISSLPTARFRQEVAYEKNGLLIVNDSASTSPEAGIAALRRFSLEAKRRGVSFLFIAGGTDKGLSYDGWAVEVGIARDVLVSKDLSFQLFLLDGSATMKMEEALLKYQDIKISRYRDVEISKYRDLETIVKMVKGSASKSLANNKRIRGVIVFSPSAASFEKFKNEFDRGEQFNKLAKKYLMV